MANGLTLQEALRVTAALSAGDGPGSYHERFSQDPAKALAELGIDASASLGSCATVKTLASAQQIRQMHDMMVGRLLTAHAAHVIHDATV